MYPCPIRAFCITYFVCKIAGWTSCEFILTTTLGLQIISTYNLVGITIVRYFSIRDPLRFPIRFTRRCALDAVVAIWVLLGLTACAFFLRKRPRKFLFLNLIWLYRIVVNIFIAVTPNERQDISVHLSFGCLFNSLYGLVSKEISNAASLTLSEGNPPMTDGFP